MEFGKPERYGGKSIESELLKQNQEQDLVIGLHEWDQEITGEHAKKLEHQREDLERQVSADHLTGLRNLRSFEQALEQSLKIIRGEIEEKREKPFKELALISIDIDHFKQVNDTLGHPAGDEVLQRVAELLMESVRGSDIVARVGGEELMVLMQGADMPAAMRHAEELRRKIEKLRFVDKLSELRVTASFGVVSSRSSTDAKTLRESVDKALYAAKEGGRNQVAVI